MSRYPWVPYVAPFGAFIGLLALHPYAPVPELIYEVGWIVAIIAVLIAVSRPVLDFRIQRLAASIAIGIAVFALWILPDLLSPAYRHSWVFVNFLTSPPQSSLSGANRSDPVILALRTARATLIVPIVEELFWRAWLMRWIISPNFRKIPLGAYSAVSFWLVAALFASEHGAYWDVGLAAGIVYNWWMIRTKSLGDLILAHAVTNGCLCAYVIAAGKWEYWL